MRVSPPVIEGAADAEKELSGLHPGRAVGRVCVHREGNIQHPRLRGKLLEADANSRPVNNPNTLLYFPTPIAPVGIAFYKASSSRSISLYTPPHQTSFPSPLDSYISHSQR